MIADGTVSRVEINITDAQKGWRKGFGLKHLDIFARSANLSDRMKIWVSGASPACFHFDIDNNPELGWARFWLAPHNDP